MNQKKIDTRVANILERIRLVRISKKISIEKLATGANVSRSYIYYIEKKKKIPTLTVLLRIADALDVSVEDFFYSESFSVTDFQPDGDSKIRDKNGTSSKIVSCLSFLYANRKKIHDHDFLTCLEKSPSSDTHRTDGLFTYNGLLGSQNLLVYSFRPIFNNDKEIFDLEVIEINQSFVRKFPENRTLLYSTLLWRTVYHHFDTVLSVCNTVWKTEKSVRIVLDTKLGNKEYACEFSRSAFDSIVVSVRPVYKRNAEYTRELFPYYNLFSTRPPMMVVDCTTGRILGVNEAAVRFYGWPRRQFLRKTVYEISTNPPSVIRARLAAGGENGDGSEQNFKVAHRFADGSSKRVGVHLSSCLCGENRIQYASIMQTVSSGPPPLQRVERRCTDKDVLTFAAEYEDSIGGINELFGYMKKKGKISNYAAGDRFSECCSATLPMFGFIIDGLFRVYYETFSGREYTLEYLRPGDIIDSLIYSSCFSDYEITIEAILPGRTIVIEQSQFKRRAATDPHAFEFLYRLVRKRLGAVEKHVMMLLSDNAKGRYEQFIHEEADVAGILRGQEIASYLGITPETLSRIRNAD